MQLQVHGDRNESFSSNQFSSEQLGFGYISMGKVDASKDGVYERSKDTFERSKENYESGHSRGNLGTRKDTSLSNRNLI